MPWICNECKTPIQKIITPINEYDRSPDIGEPVYRKQTFLGGKRIVTMVYCSPECSTAANENK